MQLDQGAIHSVLLSKGLGSSALSSVLVQKDTLYPINKKCKPRLCRGKIIALAQPAAGPSKFVLALSDKNVAQL